MKAPTLDLRALPKLQWVESVPPTDFDLEGCISILDVPRVLYHVERRVFFMVRYPNVVQADWYYANPVHDVVEGGR